MTLLSKTIESGQALVAKVSGRDAEHFRSVERNIADKLAELRTRAESIEMERQQLALAEQEGDAAAGAALSAANAAAAVVGARVRDLEAARAAANRNATADAERQRQALRDAELGKHRIAQSEAHTTALEIEQVGTKLAELFIRFDGQIEAVRAGHFKLHGRGFSAASARRLERDKINGVWSEFMAARGVPNPLLNASNHGMRANYASFAEEIDQRLRDYDLSE